MANHATELLGACMVSTTSTARRTHAAPATHLASVAASVCVTMADKCGSSGGDGRSRTVAVLAPSGGAAAVFPALREQGMRRLADVLGLEVRMLPTSTLSGEALTPEARAADLNTAFGDVTVAAIVCTIGGDDCIRVLPYLDLELIRANPKPLLGYSDTTTLHLLLYKLGHVSLYGGALLTQFAISGPSMHSYTATAIRAAVLEPERPFAVKPSENFQDGYLDSVSYTHLRAHET